MGRIVGRRRIREGRGIGEVLGEYVAIAAIAGAIVAGVRWYFVVYLNSPSNAIQTFIGALNTANTERQYDMLSSYSKSRVKPTEYSRRPAAVGLSPRIARTTIPVVKEEGDQARATVNVAVRRVGGPLYEANSDNFVDDYALVREQGKWKILLERCNLRSFQAAQR